MRKRTRDDESEQAGTSKRGKHAGTGLVSIILNYCEGDAFRCSVVESPRDNRTFIFFTGALWGRSFDSALLCLPNADTIGEYFEVGHHLPFAVIGFDPFNIELQASAAGAGSSLTPADKRAVTLAAGKQASVYTAEVDLVTRILCCYGVNNRGQLDSWCQSQLALADQAKGYYPTMDQIQSPGFAVSERKILIPKEFGLGYAVNLGDPCSQSAVIPYSEAPVFQSLVQTRFESLLTVCQASSETGAVQSVVSISQAGCDHLNNAQSARTGGLRTQILVNEATLLGIRLQLRGVIGDDDCVMTLAEIRDSSHAQSILSSLNGFSVLYDKVALASGNIALYMLLPKPEQALHFFPLTTPTGYHSIDSGPLYFRLGEQKHIGSVSSPAFRDLRNLLAIKQEIQTKWCNDKPNLETWLNEEGYRASSRANRKSAALFVSALTDSHVVLVEPGSLTDDDRQLLGQHLVDDRRGLNLFCLLLAHCEILGELSLFTSHLCGLTAFGRHTKAPSEKLNALRSLHVCIDRKFITVHAAEQAFDALPVASAEAGAGGDEGATAEAAEAGAGGGGGAGAGGSGGAEAGAGVEAGGVVVLGS